MGNAEALGGGNMVKEVNLGKGMLIFALEAVVGAGLRCETPGRDAFGRLILLAVALWVATVDIIYIPLEA